MLGATLVILGLVKGIGYFSKDKYHLAFQFDFALGLLSVLSGLLFIFRAEALLSLLPIMMGLIILIDSLFKLQTAFDAKRFGLHTWGGLLVSSILLAVFGLILLLEPFKSLTAAISLLGFTLVLDGLQHILLAVYTIKISKTKSK